jgi:hypothetical protein
MKRLDSMRLTTEFRDEESFDAVDIIDVQDLFTDILNELEAKKFKTDSLNRFVDSLNRPIESPREAANRRLYNKGIDDAMEILK